MNITYEPLWNLLEEYNMKKKDLREKANLSENCIANMGKNMNISMSNLYKICTALNCTPNDVFEFIYEEKNNDQ